MNMIKETKNRKDIARYVADYLGYTVKDVEEILQKASEVKQLLLQQGYSIKDGKDWKLKLEIQKSKRCWDGVNHVYFTTPEKIKLKIIPLVDTKSSLEQLNENYKEKN